MGAAPGGRSDEWESGSSPAALNPACLVLAGEGTMGVELFRTCFFCNRGFTPLGQFSYQYRGK
jgi:hypothetical protein